MRRKKTFTFVGQIVPYEILNEHFDDLKNIVDLAGNTFYTAVLEGLADHGYSVTAISSIPIFVIGDNLRKSYNGVDYKFYPYIDKNILRFIKSFLRGAKQIREFYKVNRKLGTEGVAIFNVLRISLSMGGLAVCKLYKVKTIGVVTDVPGYRIQKKKKSLVERLADKIGQIILNQFDSYVLLSEAMKDIVNVRGKRYTILEGIYDQTKEKQDLKKRQIVHNSDKFVIAYAGSLHYQYGVMNLIKAVQTCNLDRILLKIYGAGEAAEEISEIAKNDKRILFGGLIPRNQLIFIEKGISLLVNPRPVDDPYVKYSFPSKNMEYMASGTPTLLTEIPSLPAEYKEFVILAKDNSVEELRKKILMAFENWKTEKYKNLGIEAKNFINKNKNRTAQTLKIVNMVENNEKNI